MNKIKMNIFFGKFYFVKTIRGQSIFPINGNQNILQIRC